MKLIVQIPCYNEAETLPLTLADLPLSVEGFDTVEWLVIDDGSHDGTAEIARALGVHHVVQHPRNRGLARAFVTGLEAAIERGADVIVNTDADNQYCGADIPKLTAPIVDKKAEIVIGTRPIQAIEHFSATKKILQKIGSFVVRLVSRTDVADAPSGFRAFSREAAQRLTVFSNYTYTLETIIQAGQKNMAVKAVPIRVNRDLRPSRLVKSIPSYIFRSLSTMLRIFVVYRPFRFFGTIGSLLLVSGLAVGLRFLYFYLSARGNGHVQSLILASILIGMGFQTLLIAFIADLLAANRKLIEQVRFSQHKVLERVVPHHERAESTETGRPKESHPARWSEL